MAPNNFRLREGKPILNFFKGSIGPHKKGRAKGDRKKGCLRDQRNRRRKKEIVWSTKV